MPVGGHRVLVGVRVRRMRCPVAGCPRQTFREQVPGVLDRYQWLLREIRERGYQGSSNLLVRYINQGRLDSDRPHLSPRRVARILLTRPDRLTGGEAETLARIEAACPS